MFLKQFQAVIFDMDGLLLNTEQISLDTFLETCRIFDLEPEPEIYLRCVGTNDNKTREIILDAFGSNFPYDAMRKIWVEKYENQVQTHPNLVKSGAKDFLKFIADSSLKTALATSTNYQMAVTKLKKTELFPFFLAIVGGDQVKHSKPSPEIYLKAAQLIEVDPKDCLVLEDSDIGVSAAHHAGMFVIQIPDLKAPSPETRALGHQVFPSFKELRTFLKNETGTH
ncbi:MAG: HAD family phosphatase [SAR324 cluster bacterium]|nr:HAD family phosphatase [SAR324 cluster bacterium]